jgi:hypothetical protein
MTGHFGPRVVGDEAFAAAQKRARGGSAFGPRVRDVGDETEAARQSTPINEGGAGLSIDQFTKTLQDNPSFLDTLFVQELERPEGPRRGALEAARSTAIKLNNRSDIVREADELLNDIGPEREATARGGPAKDLAASALRGAAETRSGERAERAANTPPEGGTAEQKQAALDEAAETQSDPMFRGSRSQTGQNIMDDIRRQTATTPRPGSAATGAEPSGVNAAALGVDENVSTVGIIPGEENKVMGTAGFVPGQEPEVVKRAGEVPPGANTPDGNTSAEKAALDASLPVRQARAANRAASETPGNPPSEPTETAAPTKALGRMNATELRAEAKRLNVEVADDDTKADITNAIKKAQRKSARKGGGKKGGGRKSAAKKAAAKKGSSTAEE